jgi:hypothetical protein
MIPLLPIAKRREKIRSDLKKVNEVEGINNASVIIRYLSIGITTVTVIKLITTNSLNLVHTKKNSVNPIHSKYAV